MSETVSPAPRLDAGVELACHHIANSFFFGRAVKVEIVSQVRIMVEGLHHSSWAFRVLELLANGLQVHKRGGNPLLFLLNFAGCPIAYVRTVSIPGALK